MKITRRSFVQTLGSAAAVTVAGGGLREAFGQTSPATIGRSTLLSLNSTQVRAMVGRRFLATADGRSLPLVLAEVSDLKRSANAAKGYKGECYSMVFKSGKNVPLDQGVYQLSGQGLDQVSALLVPTGRRRHEFELVVNRISR